MHYPASGQLQPGQVEEVECGADLTTVHRERSTEAFQVAALDRVLRALNHPVRRRILRAISRRPASASALASAFEEEVGLISYHLNQVLARECGVVELVDTVARRGALEKIYALNLTTWEALQDSPELAQAEFDLLPLGVGSAALGEIRHAQEEFRDRVHAAVRVDREQRSDGVPPTHRVIVGMANIGVPDLD